MKLSRFARTTSSLAVLLLAGSIILLSQATLGRIVGTARDSSGAPVLGAKVTISNEKSGEAYVRTTDGTGNYSVETLIPGLYKIYAEASGFQSVDITGITVQVDQTARFDIAFVVGNVSESIVVTAAAPVLSHDTSDVGQVVSSRQIADLPLNGRDFLQLASLTNGVILIGNGTQSGAEQLISDGNRQVQNSYLIDGVETRLQREGEPGDDLSIDAIQEFKVLQNSFSAEYGRATAIVNAVIKSGTNQIHGTAFEFVRNNFFDARNAFDLTNVVPPLRRNQFGGSIGGPIKKNKLFYFVNYEGQREAQSTTQYAIVPTPSQLAGNLGTVQIPASQISQYAKALTPYWPAPNSALVTGYNYVGVVPNPTSIDQGTARIDYIISERDRISGHYQAYDRNATNQSLLPYSGTQVYVHGYNLSAEYIHTFTPSLLNIFTFGYMHTNSLTGPYPVASASPISTFGLQNLDPQPNSYGPPNTNIAGFSSIGIGGYIPEGSLDEDRQFEDQVAYVRGKQSLKFGTDIRLYRWNDLGYATQNGLYYFNGEYTGNALGDFLKGIPDYVYVDQLGPGYTYAYDTTNGEYSFYAQDDIRLLPNLTINAGLRYEYVQWPKEDRNQFAEWDFQTQSLASACKQIPCRVAPPYYKGWSPRLGFAWTPFRKTVVRAGSSIMYGNFRQWEVSLFHFTPPFVYEYFLNNTVPTPSFTTSTLWPAVQPNVQNINFNLTTVDYQNPDKVLPKYYEWNFNVQQELLPNLLFQIGYVGNRGVHLPVRYDANAPIDGARPYPNVGFVSSNASAGWSSYNALDLKIEKRYSSGLSVLGAYTWSKNLGIRDYDNYTLFSFTNLRSSYGPVQNIPQVATISFTYELPIGTGKPFLGGARGVVGEIVNGWQVSGIVSFLSGESLDVASYVFNGQGNRAGNVPNCVASPSLPSGQQSITHWFNTAAFQNPAVSTYGNCGIGVLSSPGLQEWDLSLFKSVKLGERATFQLRMENFNAFNHVNYNAPDTNLGDSTFGVISGAAPGREIQLGAKIIF
jgi:outer membrane receptor protein involved in Fe transport